MTTEIQQSKPSPADVENEENNSIKTPCPTRDILLEAVNNRRRRYALHYLQQEAEDGPVDLATVSTQIAAWEQGVELTEISYSDRKNVQTSLYQFHAPKLDTIGLIDFEKRASTLELTDYGERLWFRVDVTQNPSKRMHVLLSLGGLSMFLAGGVAVDAPGFAALSDALWVLVTAGLFVLSCVWVSRYEWNRGQVVDSHPPPSIEESKELLVDS